MILRLIALASLALFLTPATTEAAKGNKGKKGGSRMLSRFDRNQNGTIDGQEVARVQAAYAALAALDADKNGVLSESELAAAKVPAGGRRGKKKTQ